MEYRYSLLVVIREEMGLHTQVNFFCITTALLANSLVCMYCTVHTTNNVQYTSTYYLSTIRTYSIKKENVLLEVSHKSVSQSVSPNDDYLISSHLISVIIILFNDDRMKGSLCMVEA